ncbi:MAG: hypothetical protein HYX24_03760 [Candidatus Aenigmarchaeota archaeon]|nr:hypothetical protein [Candidatus Aenigmarchaeota archaeon]
MLRRLNIILKDEKYRSLFFDSISDDRFVALMRNPPPSSSVFELLRSENLLPTPALLSFIEDGDGEGKTRLNKLREHIRHGNFNPSDPLHVELEYSRYRLGGLSAVKKKLSDADSKLSIDDFRNLPRIAENGVVIGKRELEYAELTAREALNVFYLILEKKTGKQAPLLVIGNSRYGSQFVVEPIQDLIMQNGVMVEHEYIKSQDFYRSRFDDEQKRHATAGHISVSAWKLIAEHNPDIIVVDGTQLPEHEMSTRFPAAMLGYINAFLAYNAACGIDVQKGLDIAEVQKLKHLNPSHGYKISFWAPKLTERVFVGEYEYRPQHTGEEDRELLLVCSTTQGKDYSQAYFDNPDEYIKDIRVGFTRKGISYAPVASDEETFVAVMQGIVRSIAMRELK